jgi:hypothetical protein
MAEKQVGGTALRDREGNVYFIDPEMLEKAKVTDEQTASVLGERIDEGVEVQGFSFDGRLGFTGVFIDASSVQAVRSQSFSTKQITRIPDLQSARGVALW